MIKALQRYFLTGLLAVTPLVVTVWILWRFYELMSDAMRPWVGRIPAIGQMYPEFVLTLLGVIAFVLLIALVGLFTRNLIGIAFFRLVDRFFERIPVVKSIFTALKQISGVFLRDQRTAFQQVVLFAYPREGLYSLGFVTRDEPEDDLVNVFLPTTPNPTSGFMLLVPRGELTALPLPVEEAIKLIVAGGAIMTPEQAALIRDRGARLPAFPAGDEAPAQDARGDDAEQERRD